jgi:hypothetical protein
MNRSVFVFGRTLERSFPPAEGGRGRDVDRWFGGNASRAVDCSSMTLLV